MEFLIIELLSCIGTGAISFIYEGKALLSLGKENYKIKLGCFEEGQEEFEKRFFPVISKKVSKFRFYSDYIIFMIPGINLIYSLIKGMKKNKNIVESLKSKDLITLMSEEEIKEYNSIKDVGTKMDFILFNSIDTYKAPDDKILDNIEKCSTCEENEQGRQMAKILNEYYKNNDECYKNDMSYLNDKYPILFEEPAKVLKKTKHK